jgi:hypothetical protein
MIQKARIAFVCLLFVSSLFGQQRGITRTSEASSERSNLITDFRNKTYNFNKAGHYRLGTHFAIDPTLSTTMLHITADNVQIDMYGFSLSHKDCSRSDYNVTGIYIADGLSNITIKNGNVNSIQGTGIIVGKNCFNITLNNMTISQAKSGGIEIQSGTDTVFINNCFAGKSVSVGKNNFGLSLTSNKNINIKNCSFIGTRAPTGYNAHGVVATNCVDCALNDCALNGNSGDTVAGVCLNNCIAFEMDNIETNGNSSNVGRAAGIEISGGQGNIIEKSAIFYNKAATHAYGIYLHSGASYNQIGHCAVSCQKADTTGNAAGIYILTGTSNVIHGISAFGNTAGSLTTSKGSGITLASTFGAIIEESTCNFNNGGTGKGYGINLMNASKCVIEDCKFYYNHGSTNSWGIQEGENSFSYMASNVAFGNNINYDLTHSTINEIQNINFKSARSVITSNRGNINVTS